MTDHRVIRIENVQFDYLDARVEGTAVCRAPDGVVVKRRLSVPGHVGWTHGQAVRALTRHSLAH